MRSKRRLLLGAIPAGLAAGVVASIFLWRGSVPHAEGVPWSLREQASETFGINDASSAYQSLLDGTSLYCPPKVSSVVSSGQNEDSKEGEDKGREADREWATFSLTATPFAWLSRPAPCGVDVSALYRHRELNPNDTYIAKGQRASLSRLMDDYKRTYSYLEALTRKAYEEEIAKYLASGAFVKLPEPGPAPEWKVRLLTKAYEKMPGIRKIEPGDLRDWSAIEREYDIITYRNGAPYGGHTRHMPMYQAIRQYTEYVSNEWTTAILSWFVTRGLCSVSVVERVLSERSARQKR